MKRGFTLVELLTVIAILAIISTLAVSKIGNVRRTSAMRMSMANQSALERAFDAYLSVHSGRVNRLDSLMYKEGVVGADGGGFDFAATNVARSAGRFLYQGPAVPESPTDAEADRNAGLTPELRAVLAPYALSVREAEAFSGQAGLRFVMCHMRDATRSASDQYGTRAADGDGTCLPVDASLGWSAELSACVPQRMTNGLYVAAVNPAVGAGRAIYRDFGQELMDLQVDDRLYDAAACVAEAKATGGVLFAFGLGESCSAVGKGQAGLESAPYCEYPHPRHYRHFLVLFRLDAERSSVPEFAGVLDPCGNTIRTARRNLSRE